MPNPILIVCRDSETLAAKAAELIVKSGQEAAQRHGRFTWVLSGGSTPEKTYAHLVQPERIDALEWSKVYVFFGDERIVSADDPRSNFGMARRALLSRVPIPTAHVFPITTSAPSAADAAEQYAADLAAFFARPSHNMPPQFDLILLGLGDDGHTASLFPDKPALRVDDKWTTWSTPGRLPPAVDRITLTYPVLNAAHEVLFLVAGENKAQALKDSFERRLPQDQCPAAGVQPVEGTLTWLADESAARLLS
ncbi:MAG TPA: 6-phosphogluconolactonase [Planctomycetaceae bacterium]|nr:6-phosphogluconolactonase [Planctomycetaceae bacterium]